MSMSDKSRSHRRSCCAAIAVCAAIVPAVADAQDAEIDRIEAIERKIHGLESELQRLKGELGEAKQQLRQSRSEALRAKEGARQAREAANRARQDAAKVVTIEAPATRPAPHAPAAPAAPPGCCRLGRHHGRHAARPADYRDRRWPDVVRNRRVVAVRYGRLLPKPAANDWNVHLEFSGQTVFHPNVNSNGIPGVSRTTLSFGARIAFDQLVDTGPLSYYQVGVTQSKLPGVPAPRLEFNGGYIEGSVVSERLAALHAAIPICRRKQAEFQRAQYKSASASRRLLQGPRPLGVSKYNVFHQTLRYSYGRASHT